MKQLPLNFVGNVEGREIFSGDVNVVVCDGFIGNVALKVSEGVAQHIATLLKKALQSTMASKVGSVLSRSAYRGISQEHRLFRIRRGAAAGRSRHYRHRPWRVQRQRHQERRARGDRNGARAPQ